MIVLPKESASNCVRNCKKYRQHPVQYGIIMNEMCKKTVLITVVFYQERASLMETKSPKFFTILRLVAFLGDEFWYLTFRFDGCGR